jgi:hypothetical protein
MRQQFTISPTDLVTIGANGVVVVDHTPAGRPDRGYAKNAVQLAVRHDLSIELHGKNFSATKKLTTGEALGLISTLAYLLREDLEFARGVQ